MGKDISSALWMSRKSTRGRTQKVNIHQGKADIEELSGKKPFKIDVKDLIIMSVMTLIYLAVALFNLGSTKVPQTFWKPDSAGETFTVSFDREYRLSEAACYAGVGKLGLKVDYLQADGKYTSLPDLSIEDDMNLSWRTYDLNVSAKALRFTVNSPGGTLDEIVLFEKDNEKPVKISSIKTENISPKSVGKVDYLFDEQNFDTYRSNYMNSSYFDEIYHPRTAFEHLNGMEPYETSHPPLGKLLIAVGIMIFGMNPFGWRIMGTLFGAAMIPLMYVFGRKVFSKRICGFIGAFLMMFDFMHFAQTRIGSIDSYSAFFIILSYYFMYDSFINKSYNVGLKKSLLPLLLSGISWGLGCATKWTAVYAGAGLAVLYLTSRLLEYMDYKKALNKKNAKKGISSWANGFLKKSIVIPTLSCVAFFIVIPAAIYAASYLPIVTLPGSEHGPGEVWRYQKDMYDYHSSLSESHPYSSTAETWPLVKKPLYEYKGKNLPEGRISVIYVLGNPAVFWFGIASVFITLMLGIFKKDKRVIPLLVAFSFQYLPWFFIDRCLFIYHFFTATPFMMLCTAYVLYNIKENLPIFLADIYMNNKALKSYKTAAAVFTYSYLVITGALFVLFYPSISGIPVDQGYLKLVGWLGVRY